MSQNGGMFSASTGALQDVKKRFDIDNYLEKTDNKYLHEKLMHPMKWRWKLRLMNICGAVYFMLFTVIVFIVGLTTTLPVVYEDDPELFWYREILSYYICVMTFLNYFLIVYSFRKSKFGPKTLRLPSVKTSHWRRCPNCEIIVPPRAKHCILCDSCVLKRDHHCFFAGCCIGFHNQRYFIVFCFYGCLGALFSLYATYFYLDEFYTALFSWDFYGYLLPWLLWRWFTGSIHHSILWLTILLYMSFATFCACAYFFVWQIVLLFTGQTTYELLKVNKTYKQSLYDNLHSVFGSWSLLNFLIPLPWIQNKGDGIEWRTTWSEEKIL